MVISLADLERKMGNGCPVELLAKELDWRDFEGLVAEIFSANGFRTFRNFRFSSNGRRYEVDVVALERPKAIVVDCKHWGMRPGKSSSLKNAATDQLRRAVELSKRIHEFPKMSVYEWGSVDTTPILVTLYQEGITENGGVLVVPLFRLNSFLDELRSGLFDSFKIRSEIPTLQQWAQQKLEKGCGDTGRQPL